MRFVVLIFLTMFAGCDTSVFTRDGVTDGNTFYLAPRALQDNDPVLQSWVTYSLMISACQLELGGSNPARNSDYGCEYTARRHLVEAWQEKRREKGGAADDYLDALLAVEQAGQLRAYTVHYFGRPGWHVPAEVDMVGFYRWRDKNLPRHRAQTRLIGSWNYRAL